MHARRSAPARDLLPDRRWRGDRLNKIVPCLRQQIQICARARRLYVAVHVYVCSRLCMFPGAPLAPGRGILWPFRIHENIGKKHGSRPWLPLFSRFCCVFVFRVCSRIVHFMFHDCRSRAGRRLKAMQDSTTNGLSCAQNAAPGRPKIATRSSNVRPT